MRQTLWADDSGSREKLVVRPNLASNHCAASSHTVTRFAAASTGGLPCLAIGDTSVFDVWAITMHLPSPAALPHYMWFCVYAAMQCVYFTYMLVHKCVSVVTMCVYVLYDLCIFIIVCGPLSVYVYIDLLCIKCVSAAAYLYIIFI